MSGRKKPYTNAQIKKIPCLKCGQPSSAQWQICADDNIQRGICTECDIALNRLVLEWVGDPDTEEKMRAYEETERGR